MPDPFTFNPANLPQMALCCTYGDQVTDLILEQIAFPAIRQYNRDLFRDWGHDLPQLDCVHVLIKTVPAGANDWLDITVPKAERHELILNPHRRYSFHEYKFASWLDAEAVAAFERFIEQTAGTVYDVPQLLDIWFKQNLGWVPFRIPKLELGYLQTVCSAGCAAALLTAYQNKKRRLIASLDLEDSHDQKILHDFELVRPIPKFSPQYPYVVEETPPALFPMLTHLYSNPFNFNIEFPHTITGQNA